MTDYITRDEFCELMARCRHTMLVALVQFEREALAIVAGNARAEEVVREHCASARRIAVGRPELHLVSGDSSGSAPP